MLKNWSPDWEFAPRSLVVMSKAREVHAFFCAMARSEPGVRPLFERNEGAALIYDGDIHGPADLFCFFLRCGDDAPRIWKLNHDSSSSPRAWEQRAHGLHV
jgi:hypothetical protein